MHEVGAGFTVLKDTSTADGFRALRQPVTVSKSAPKPTSISVALVKRGTTGQNIKTLQSQLQSAGYDCGPIDGIFGPKTDSAVRRFQAAHGLVVDGIVGKLTQAALDKAVNGAGKSAVPQENKPWAENPSASPPETPTNKAEDAMANSPLMYMKDRAIFSDVDYAIFLDNVRIDQFVKTFNTQAGIDGVIGSASIEMIYVPDLYVSRKAHTVAKIDAEEGTVNFIDAEYQGDGIENMTNLRIFIKNVFSGKYCCVFDGNINGKSLIRSADGYSISFLANDYMTWLNRTVVPLAVPFEDKLNPNARLRWLGQGIDIDQIETVATLREIHFKGKSLQEMWGEIVDKTLSRNRLYTNSDAFQADKPLDRVKIMAEIDQAYKDANVVDFVVTSTATSVNSIYVLMNNLVSTMLLEFFQDRDGTIRIKAPYWSEPILKNYVIDPGLLLNFSESINWSNYYTRTIATGGLEWWQEDYDNFTSDLVTPTAVFSDRSAEDGKDGITSNSVVGSVGGATVSSQNIDLQRARSGVWLDNYKITSGYGAARTINGVKGIHTGTDYSMPEGTPVQFVGSAGIVHNIKNTHPNSGGLQLSVRVQSGTYAGYLVIFSHLLRTNVSIGQQVGHGTIVGYSGGGAKGKETRTAGNSTGAHLHLQVQTGGGKTINPVTYLRNTGNPSTYVGYEAPVGDTDLLTPSTYEKKYGPSVLTVDQPLIKFSSAGNTQVNTGSAAEALQEYAKFMLKFSNSAAKVASMQTVAMPWIRPGFNIWVDPVGLDKVYYVNGINFQGSAQGGVYMSWNLSMGRTLTEFLSGSESIAGLDKKPATDRKSSNRFVNKLLMTADNFGKPIGVTDTEYNEFRSNMLKFHLSLNQGQTGDSRSAINAKDSFYFKSLYSDSADPSPVQSTPSSPATVSSAGNVPVGNAQGAQGGGGGSGGSGAVRNIARRGSRGDDIIKIQTALQKQGYTEVGTIDGIFGQKTEEAVKRFQRENGLVVDGIVGAQTKAKLFNLNSDIASGFRLLRETNKSPADGFRDLRTPTYTGPRGGRPTE